jgi:hypothetical protein
VRGRSDEEEDDYRCNTIYIYIYTYITYVCVRACVFVYDLCVDENMYIRRVGSYL